MKTSIIYIFIFINLISYGQEKDSLVYVFTDKYEVYKNLNSKLFSVKEKTGKSIFKKLKYVCHLGTYLQVLDNENDKFYINEEGKKTSKTNINLSLCGTVPHYTYKIIETDNQYIITKNETFIDYNDKIPPIKIDSINKTGIERIGFSNNQKELTFDDNDFVLNYTKVYPYSVFLEKENKKGILYNNKVTFYDEITYYDKNSFNYGLIKVKIKNSYGFFGVTETKYKELGDFIFGLAEIVTFDNRRGYVDTKGIEYF